MKNKILSILLICLILFFSNFLMAGLKPLTTSGKTSSTVSEWKGIMPGKSSIVDVINVEGLPDNIQITKFSNRYYFEFSYLIKEKIFKNELKDKYYFDINGRVSWITIPIGDRNQKIHMISEESEILGKSPDTIYWNNSINSGIIFDLHAGPDQVYVWSNRGIALLGIPGCYSVNENKKIRCNSNNKKLQNATEGDFTPTYNPLYELVPNYYDHNALLIYKIIFPSTTYENFIENYSYVIPFWGGSIWELYLEKYR
jgi:hypothetical protein